MLTSTTSDDAPLIPYLPELILRLTAILVLAALIFLVVKLARNQGRREGSQAT